MRDIGRLPNFAIAALLLTTVTGWVGVRWANEPAVKVLFDNLHWTAGYACGALFAFRAYRSTTHDGRTIARWVWIGLLTLTAGQLVWDVQVVFGWLPFPGPSDAFFVATGFLVSVGLAQEALTRLDISARRALLLDTFTFTVGVLCLCLVLYLPKQGTYSWLQLAVMLIYPVSLILPAALAILLMLTLQVQLTWRAFALPLFLALFAGCWTRWNLLFLLDQLSDGAWLNLSFSFVAIGLGWSVAHFRLDQSASKVSALRSDSIVRFLPMVMVVLAAAGAMLVNLNEAYSDNIQTLSMAGSMVVIALAMVRQSYLLRDRDRILAMESIVSEREKELQELNRELERRVEIRTKELVSSQKLAALGALVAGIAHELNTPIGNVRIVASTLREEATTLKSILESGNIKKSELTGLLDRTTQAADLIDLGLEKAATLISSFKQISVDRTAERRRVFKLVQLVSEIVRVQQVTLRNRKITFNVNIPDAIELDSFPGPLGQLLDILIENAHFHGFTGEQPGTIDISAEASHEGRVQILVADSGKGIDPADLDRIFEPFFTTKFGQGGSGLGLHIAWNIVTEVLDGSIQVTSETHVGTRFCIDIPLVSR